MKIKLISIFIILPYILSAQQSKVDSVLKILNNHSKDSIEVKALNWLAADAENKNTALALKYYIEAIKISETYSIGSWTISSYTRLAYKLTGLGQNDSARLYLEKASNLLKNYKKKDKLLYGFYNASGILNKNTGHYEESLKNYKSISELGENIIGKENIAGNFLNIANIYTKQSKLLLAQENLYKALKIFEELKNETGIAFCFNGLGIQFYDQKNYKKAEYYLEKALLIKKKIGNKKTLSIGYNGLGVLYMDQKKYSLALENINQSIAIAEEFKMKDRICEGLINQGMVYHFQNKQNEAFNSYDKAKILAQELQNDNYLSKINLELSNLFNDQIKKDNVFSSLLKGLNHAKQAKNLDFEKTAHYKLANLYYNDGQFKNAFEAYRNFHQLYDSLEGSAVKLKLYELEAKYENQKKETEIQLLKKDQQIQFTISQKQKIIQIAILSILGLVISASFLFFRWFQIINKTKRKLEIEKIRNNIAQDLHDDIGSTLSTIKIISKMASQKSLNEIEKNNFSLIENFSGKMLETMMDIIWSINPNKDTADEVIIHMKEFAAEILEPKDIIYHFSETGNFENLKMSILLRKNLFLIFKEALNNAAKYSKCSEIYIDLTLLSGKLSLLIRDNGEGFDYQKIKMGNGLKNMKERATLLNGDFEIKTKYQAGTQIFFSTNIT